MRQNLDFGWRCAVLIRACLGPRPGRCWHGVGSSRHSRSSSELSKWQVNLGYQFNRINLLGSPLTRMVKCLHGALFRQEVWRGGSGGGVSEYGRNYSPPSLTVKSLLRGVARTSRFAAMAGSNPGHTPSSEWNFSALARRQGCLENTRDWQEWAVRRRSSHHRRHDVEGGGRLARQPLLLCGSKTFSSGHRFGFQFLAPAF